MYYFGIAIITKIQIHNKSLLNYLLLFEIARRTYDHTVKSRSCNNWTDSTLSNQEGHVMLSRWGCVRDEWNGNPVRFSFHFYLVYTTVTYVVLMVNSRSILHRGQNATAKFVFMVFIVVTTCFRHSHNVIIGSQTASGWNSKPPSSCSFAHASRQLPFLYLSR